MTENNCECYAVTFQNKGWIKVQKFQDESLDKNIIYMVNPLEIFLGKNESCTMTALSGAFNKKCFDGNTILLKVGIENGKHKFVYIGGDMVCSFITSDTIYIYMNMFLIWEIICLLIVLLQAQKITICRLQILNLLKRLRLIMILYWMEYTLQILICLFKN